MAHVYSVDYLANQYASNRLESLQIPNADQRVIQLRREKWDFTTIGFNATTVAAITTVALAVILNSVVFFFAALAALGARHAFMVEADATGPDPIGQRAGDDAIRRVFDLDLQARASQVKEYMAIRAEGWSPVALQILGFRVWMNRTPGTVLDDAAVRPDAPVALAEGARAPVVPAPVQQAVAERPVDPQEQLLNGHNGDDEFVAVAADPNGHNVAQAQHFGPRPGDNAALLPNLVVNRVAINRAAGNA